MAPSSPSKNSKKQQGTTASSPSSRSPQKIIVLGAGVSGLGCARELKQRGFDVLIVEARSRVGGRLKTEPIEIVDIATAAAAAGGGGRGGSTTTTASTSITSNSKKRPRKSSSSPSSAAAAASTTNGSNPSSSSSSAYPIDLGGALIHGVQDNPITAITTQLGVPVEEVSSECLLMDSSGWPFDHNFDEQMSKFFNSCLDATFARAEQDRSSISSFGSLFTQVCREKQTELGRGFGGIHASAIEHHPLLQWHRANLEIPSGASFDELGYTWNEDEQYGYAGAHSAPGQTGWGYVMEQLAQGLTVLDNSPVSTISVVVPDGMSCPQQLETLHVENTTTSASTETDKETSTDTAAVLTSSNDTGTEKKDTSVAAAAAGGRTTKTADGATTTTTTTDGSTIPPSASNQATSSIQDDGQAEISPSSSSSSPTTSSTDEITQTQTTTTTTKQNTAPSRAIKAKNGATPADPAVGAVASTMNILQPTRFSRRIRGVDADVRRSSRSTKGVIQLMNVGHDLGHCYDDPNKTSRSGKSKTKSKKSLSEDDDNDQEEHEEDARPQSKVHVTLENGTVLECDALVCTLPLGVLKVPETEPGHIQFIPPLSDSKTEAIAQLGCGLLNKCVLSFEVSFWPDSDFLGMAGLERSYLVLNAMKYTRKPILIFMYGGDVAREIEDWSDQEVVDDCLRVLKKVCGKYTIPAPIDYVVTRWSQEPFSKMSFSYIPPGADGQKQLSAMGDAIRDPVRHDKPLIMFAGEHTTPFHPSTMHGAFLSGIREAYRYDLYMNPALNHHIEFESNNIYQHTFSMPRVYRTLKIASPTKRPKTTQPKTAKKAPTTPKNSTTERERRSRRRGFGGMTLRKRPEPPKTTPNTAATTPTSASKTSKTTPRSPAVREMGVRKSQRSTAVLAANLGVGSSEAATSLNSEDLKMKRLDALEDRTLRRAVESYGCQNSFLISTKVVPIVGSTQKKSANQIRSRLNQIADTKMSPEDAAAKRNMLEKWQVKKAKSASSSGKKTSSISKATKSTTPPVVVVPNYRKKTETSEGGMSLRRSIKAPTKLQ
mmetsp:Transcript_42724/g.103052  ORF Transcript_42724/g.103052 Transcript_42724/m.103052 type:complete len:1054 (+) Transcript_42724:43-3204(+)